MADATRRELERTVVLVTALIACLPGGGMAQPPGPAVGDTLETKRHVSGVAVPLAESPLEMVPLRSPDGVDLTFAWRRPRGDGPFPVIVFLHGGGRQAGPGRLRQDLLEGAVPTRFLAAGFAVVACTRRPFWKQAGVDGEAGFDGAVDDTVRIVAEVRTLPRVDGTRVALYGGSGGGILAIVTAAHTDVAGVVAGEPATVVPLAPEAGAGGAGPRGYGELMANPRAAYVGERREAMRAWMAKVGCPVLVLQGRAEGLHTINTEILVPELRGLGKQVTVANYPDAKHGFYWGNAGTGATPELLDRIVRETVGFLRGGTAAQAAPPAATP